MIFIGLDYNNKIISIVNAKSKELAYAYWQGKDILPHSHKNLEEDYISLKEHPTGVYPILETYEKDVYELDRSKTVRLIK